MSLIFNNATQLKTYDSNNKSKKCTNPMCGKIYSVENFYCTCFGQNLFKNKNIGDLALSGFIPHLPYSWSRSLTNLDMLMNLLTEIEIAQNLYDNNGQEIKKHVFQSFLQNGWITIDASKKDDIKYIKGGPERRISEYFLTLQILNLIDEKNKLTSLGNYLIKTKNTMLLFVCFYILKIKNRFLKFSIYNDFDVYHFKNLFEVLQIQKELSLEELVFLLMAKKDEDYLKVHQIFFNGNPGINNSKLRISLIKRYYLGVENKEMGRQKGAIFNILVCSGILNFDSKTKLYSLSHEAQNLLDFINQKQDLISPLLDNINSNPDYIQYIDQLLLLLLQGILNENKPLVNNLINKTGGKHEKDMLKKFSKSNINFIKYDKRFSHIKLPAEVSSSLSGGTEHNPDALCTIKSKAILIDPKSSQSIHGEVHKVIAYNGYASEADTKAFILLDGIIPNKTILKFKNLTEENPNDIDKIAIFTKLAIDELCKNNTVKFNFEKICEENKFLLVCSKNEINFDKIESSLKNNLYII